MVQESLTRILNSTEGHWIRQSVTELLPKLRERLLQRRLTVATAESCTGGLFSSLLTEIDGSSGYFVGGVLAYDNEIKTKLLDVPPDLIEARGAVSAEVAEAMALGAIAKTGATLGVSFTGIAGPTGGSTDKPVGLVYLGLAFKNHEVRSQVAIDLVHGVQVKSVKLLHAAASSEKALTETFQLRVEPLAPDPASMTERSYIRWASCLVGLTILNQALT
jgi:PncC family amidohydrolase